MAKKVPNLTNMRLELCKVMDDLKNGKMNHQSAKEFINGVGKINATVKTQIDGFKLSKKKMDIPFLTDTK